ncbi:hypothetical protein V1517DRAFT_49340 [Lipomyces orientalis]|uniref:Uncharacterized protein n=1 Tax=Lipomyces orientalis TaxID=1233043 RepID=A0ACC3TTK0_9ASCO
MASSAQASDSNQKTLIEALIVIFRISRYEINFEYMRHIENAVPIALALLLRGYSPQSIAGDLWKYLTRTLAKRMALLESLSPVGAPFERLSTVIGVTPQGSLTWQEVSDRFHQSVHLNRAVAAWTRGMYVDLLIPMKAKGRTPTPSSTSTASRNQAIFKRKLLERDGSFSVLGGAMDESTVVPGMVRPPHGTSTLIAAHIIPFSASSRPRLRRLLSIFAGQNPRDMEGLLTENINDPSNGLLLDLESHRAFDKYKFGLECQDKHYRIRRLVEDNLLPDEVFHHDDGEVVLFGQGPQNHALPSPLFCNIHLAIGRVLHESGVARLIDEIQQDEDELKDGYVEGDRWMAVSASYLERELRGLQRDDDSGIDLEYDDTDKGSQGRFPIASFSTMCTEKS